MKPSARVWLSYFTIAIISGSSLGLFEAMLWILRGIPKSIESAILLIAYGAIGYGLCTLLLALLIYLLVRNQGYETYDLWTIATCIPIGLFITVLALSFLQGGVEQYIFFIPGSILLGLTISSLLHKFLKRVRVLNPFHNLLVIHIIMLSFGIFLLALKYNTGGWKWFGIILSLLALGLSSFVGFSKTFKKPFSLLVMTNAIMVAVLAAIPLWPQGHDKQPQFPNILLITIDTLRSDHLGCYGYASASTPHIDHITDEGVMFLETVAPSSRTGPSHISILTGLYPNHHGAIRNGDWISDKVITLPEILSANGYNTAAFVSGWTLRNEACGLAPRFQIYSENFSPWKWLPEAIFKLRLINLSIIFSSKLRKNLKRIERPAALTTDSTIRWLYRKRDHPFFLWVHYYDPHVPYEPPEPYEKMHAMNHQMNINGNWWRWDAVEREKLVKEKSLSDQMVALYDGEISYVDAEIGRMLKTLKDLQLDTKTLLIITADHGESLGEHDLYFGHDDLYDTCLKVPLIFNYPEIQWTKQQIYGQTRLIDIAPTILDLLDIDAKVQFDGKSLLPIVDGQKDKQSEEALASLIENETEMFCVRDKGFKLIWTAPKWGGSLRMPPKEELYNLQSDPDELNNILIDRPAVLKEMQELMVRFRHEKVNVKQNLSDETKKKLRSLGYIR